MKKWDYKYDYPEQREFCKLLNASDKHLVARKFGVTVIHVHAICAGRRKLQPAMKAFIAELLKVKKLMESIEVQQGH